MKQTTNLKLNKPDYEDIADVAKLNDNSDILDKEVDDRLSKSKGGTVKGKVTFEGDSKFNNVQAENITGNCIDDTVSEGSNKPVTSGAVAQEFKNHTHTRFENDLELSDKHILKVYEIEGKKSLHIHTKAKDGEPSPNAVIDISEDGSIHISQGKFQQFIKDLTVNPSADDNAENTVYALNVCNKLIFEITSYPQTGNLKAVKVYPQVQFGDGDFNRQVSPPPL